MRSRWYTHLLVMWLHLRITDRPCCYGVIGFGMALQDAAANTFVATLPNAEQVHRSPLLSYICSNSLTFAEIRLSTCLIWRRCSCLSVGGDGICFFWQPVLVFLRHIDWTGFNQRSDAYRCLPVQLSGRRAYRVSFCRGI